MFNSIAVSQGGTVRKIICLLFFWSSSLLAIETDFDVVVVGTSPISLLSALYEYHSGHRVLILEEASECGGAWKSITMCGVPHVDMGCHQIGADQTMKQFLEEYVGCKFVCLDNPTKPYTSGASNQGYYPSKGCFELIDNLTKLIKATGIVLLLNHKLESVYIDLTHQFAEVKTNGMKFTTSKILTTPASFINIENLPNKAANQGRSGKAKYFHLYILIEDHTAPRFAYQNGLATGVSRMMNLTHYVGLNGTGMQIIVIQTHGEQYLKNPETYLQQLKQKGLVDQSARLLRSETNIYEQSYFNQGFLTQMGSGAQAMFETLNTGHIQSIAGYVPKWKKVMKPYKEAITVSVGSGHK